MKYVAGACLTINCLGVAYVEKILVRVQPEMSHLQAESIVESVSLRHIAKILDGNLALVGHAESYAVSYCFFSRVVCPKAYTLLQHCNVTKLIDEAINSKRMEFVLLYKTFRVI